MAKFQKLKNSNGASEVNVDGVSYPVVNNEVTVPETAVAALTHIAGFSMEPTLDPVPDDKVRIVHDSATSCSWNGETFEANEAGHFLVPCAAVADLIAHGFIGHVESSPEAPALPPAAIPALTIPSA